MTTILGDPEKRFAVDWDWKRHLTVWTLTGRHFEARYGDKVLEHELPGRPADEREAVAAVRRWWVAQGRAQALAATAGEATPGEATPGEGTAGEGTAGEGTAGEGTAGNGGPARP